MLVADRAPVCRTPVPGISHARVVVRISLGSPSGRVNIHRGLDRAGLVRDAVVTWLCHADTDIPKSATSADKRKAESLLEG
jgi:hypothetical protein